MISYRKVVRELGTVVGGAIDSTAQAYAEGRVQQEPAFTDRMLGAIETAIDNHIIRGIRWRAWTLSDRGRNAQEKRLGADFIGVFTVALPDFKVSKGFLAQAKIAPVSSGAEHDRLREQCEKMLRFSAASFVFLYNQFCVRVVPAVSVLGVNDPSSLYSRSAQRFFEEHFQCFIGDRRIIAGTLEELKLTQRQLESEAAFLIRGGSDQQDLL